MRSLFTSFLHQYFNAQCEIEQSGISDDHTTCAWTELQLICNGPNLVINYPVRAIANANACEKINRSERSDSQEQVDEPLHNNRHQSTLQRVRVKCLLQK